MATIRKRGDKYQVQVRLKNQSPISKTFKRLTDAKQWAREQETIIDRGGSISTQTLSDAIDAYLANTPTDTNRKTMLKWWHEQLGKKRVSELRKKDFTTARQALVSGVGAKGKPVAPATVNRWMAAISAVLTHAVSSVC